MIYYYYYYQIAAWKQQFEILDINEKCCQKLYNIFKKCDLSNDGMISDLEIFMLLDVERTPFNERIFRIFDTDGSGEIDFREFVLATFNYCSLDMAFLPYFAFTLYEIKSI